MDINYKVKTSKSFEQAVEDLKKSLGNHSFGVLWELNFKDKIREKGLEFDKNFKILEACNPQKAKDVLEKNVEAGYFLPCKMVVYEDAGSVYICMPKPTSFIEAVGDDELTAVAKEVEDILKAAIDEAK